MAFSRSQKDFQIHKLISFQNFTSKQSSSGLVFPSIKCQSIKPLLRRPTAALDSSIKPHPKAVFQGLSRFTLLRTIGLGSFSRVRLAINRLTNEVVVIKTVSKSQAVKKNHVGHVHNEKNLLEELQCHFVVKLIEKFQDGYYVHMVLEYVQGGELYKLLAKTGFMKPEDARLYISEIVCALSYLHLQRVVYRDLKPENILITLEGHIKLADLGFSKRLKSLEQTFTYCGTPEYLAPEIVKETGHSFPCDWWALGVLLYEMIVGRTPFKGDTPYALYHNILTAEVTFPQYVSLETRSLVSSLLIKDPETRASETQVRTHPYFAGVAWEDVEQLRSLPNYKPIIKDVLDSSHFQKYAEKDLLVDERKWTDQDLFREFCERIEGLLISVS